MSLSANSTPLAEGSSAFSVPFPYPSSLVLQGSILVPALFNVFVSGLDTRLEGILSKFVNDTKLGGIVESLRGRVAFEENSHQCHEV